ncbi:MAG: aldo/keto reductase [Actinobacteria bacterium]|nr:aldo/keto reductase [Actinomycetota bacterium]
MTTRFDPGPVGLGCAPLGNLYRPVSDEDVVGLVDTAFAWGVRLFDTAPHYGYGLSETRLGAALADRRRDDYLLATKVGRVLVPVGDDVDDDIFVDTPPVRSSFDFSHDGVLRSIEASLARLGVDRLDLVHVHDPDDHLDAAVDEAYPALVRLRDEGVVGEIGLGTNHAWVGEAILDRVDLDRLLLAGRLTLLDDSGTAVLDRCLERGVAVLAAGVFNSGLLADPGPDARFHYEVAPPEVVARAERLAEVCRDHGTSLAAAALHRSMRHPAVTTLLVGASNGAELATDLDLCARPLPDALWSALRAVGAAV